MNDTTGKTLGDYLDSILLLRGGDAAANALGLNLRIEAGASGLRLNENENLIADQTRTVGSATSNIY